MAVQGLMFFQCLTLQQGVWPWKVSKSPCPQVLPRPRLLEAVSNLEAYRRDKSCLAEMENKPQASTSCGQAFKGSR